MIKKILFLLVIFYASNLIGQTITLKDSILNSVIINTIQKKYLRRTSIDLSILNKKLFYCQK